MTTRGGRAVPVAVAAVILSLAVFKGHSDPAKGPVAFMHEEPGIRIMVFGNVNKPGIYSLGSPCKAKTVNAMTVAGVDRSVDLSGIDFSSVCDGTVIHVPFHVERNQRVTLSMMGLRERVYLGIPVDLNRLSAREWEWLPEIGPRLAEALVADRQQNGDFTRFEDLERVPGIGETRVERIKNFVVR